MQEVTVGLLLPHTSIRFNPESTLKRMEKYIVAADLQQLLVIIFYVLCCPFTKVEESFNMQAIYDLLHFGLRLEAYDHIQFPGVVPRSFLGSLAVYIVSLPVHLVLRALALPAIYGQITCRCALGLICWASFVHFRNGIAAKFGMRASQFAVIFASFQFHLCFYMSRTLPNTFALAMCLNAFAYWLKVNRSPFWLYSGS